MDTHLCTNTYSARAGVGMTSIINMNMLTHGHSKYVPRMTHIYRYINKDKQDDRGI